jgi:hypothetical protein
VVVKVACPLLRVPVPSVVVPSRNVTVPVGFPTPGETALTVAVKVTARPKTEGFKDEPSVVAVTAWFTVWVKAGDVLPLKLLSPP